MSQGMFTRVTGVRRAFGLDGMDWSILIGSIALISLIVLLI